jgi:hypothetical protein
MTPTPKPEDEFRMPADEFDRMMRGALSSPAPDPEPKKPAREPKKGMKTKPTLKRREG